MKKRDALKPSLCSVWTPMNRKAHRILSKMTIFPMRLVTWFLLNNGIRHRARIEFVRKFQFILVFRCDFQFCGIPLHSNIFKIIEVTYEKKYDFQSLVIEKTPPNQSLSLFRYCTFKLYHRKRNTKQTKQKVNRKRNYLQVIASH